MSIANKKVVKIIPTYNESKNIPSLIGAVFNLYPESSVLVVDDSSPDGTAQAVRNMQIKFANLNLLERKKSRSFGRSYADGFKKVLADDRFDTIVMMDADFSHDPGTIKTMSEKLDNHDLVIGSRYVAGGGIANWNRKRRLLSRFANFYARTILGVPLKDLTTGFMCFKKSALGKLDLDSIHSDGYAFLVELKYRFIKAGASFYEYPIVFNERREGQSKMSGKIIWESIWMPWKLRFKKLKF